MVQFDVCRVVNSGVFCEVIVMRKNGRLMLSKSVGVNCGVIYFGVINVSGMVVLVIFLDVVVISVLIISVVIMVKWGYSVLYSSQVVSILLYSGR